MTDFENQIYQVIASSNGIKGSQIAEKLGVEKKIVNSTLARSVALKALVVQNESFQWKSRTLLAQENAKYISTHPKPDDDLRNLCNYYLNCLALESSSSVSQFLTGNFGLNYAPVGGLSVEADRDTSALRLLNKVFSGKSKDKTAYFGYPIRVFTVRSRNGASYPMVAPVFLFPISYNGGQLEVSQVPTINLEVIKGYTENTTDALISELVNLEASLGMSSTDAEIELDELVLRLVELRQWDYKEKIDPYNIPFEEDLSQLRDGIYNRAVVIEAKQNTFTLGLESELMALANMPEENYRGTALYSWIKGTSVSVDNTSIKPLLEVLPLNSEQALAVNTALRSNLTIVTGPPGTGKSQVVTDLLINIAWNGKSALFSSKNNKAVDVVCTRVNGLCKRPVVLRIGNAQHASQLADIIEGLLNTRSTAVDQTDTEYYLKEYSSLASEASSLLQKKKTTVDARNHLDAVEQNYCIIRNRISPHFDNIEQTDLGNVGKAATDYSKAHVAACKSNQNVIVRLFWNLFSKQRAGQKQVAAEKYNFYASRYGLQAVNGSTELEELKKIVSDAVAFEHTLEKALEYKNALATFKEQTPLEALDKKLSVNKASMAKVASNLWEKWLCSQAITFSANERREMTNFVSAMRLSGGIALPDGLKAQFTKLTQQMTKYLQCWAVTSLSAKSKVPFEAGIFDYVIIDEASQCDIASIIPLLYRAKNAVIIGDPKQLSHISQLSAKQDLALLQKYNVSPAWSYSSMSLYALAEGMVSTDNIVQLKDHFRCCSDIIEFSNDTFYDGSLRTATNYATLKTPAGEVPGIRWIDIRGKTVRPSTGGAYNKEEAIAIVAELKRLVSAGYKGTIGVTTPFRLQAEQIQHILEREEAQLLMTLEAKHDFIADTVHKFQGDERDVMLFSPVVSDGAVQSTLGFLEKTGNLFNVAITRARAMLVVLGNFRYCKSCNISYLSRFASYCETLSNGNPKRAPLKMKDFPWSHEYPSVPNPEQVSEWEKILYTALSKDDIKTIPQFPEDKYRLDLAIIGKNGRKLDIEVDGEMYHRQWNGELSYRDQIRNQRMFELGWDVKRFWVYQIRDELDWCVSEIRKWWEDACYIEPTEEILEKRKELGKLLTERIPSIEARHFDAVFNMLDTLEEIEEYIEWLKDAKDVNSESILLEALIVTGGI